jgi:dipeptidyl aminopeptidase/acylaminoacyl peptidase
MLTPLRLTRLRRVASLAVHPDGRWLAVAVARLDVDDAAYVHDLFCVPIDGGEAVCLTPGPWNDRSPAFRSDGTLLFLSNRPIRAKADEGETERSQIWALSDHGEATRVTDEPLGVEAFACGGGTVVALAPRWPGVAPSAQRSHRRDVVDHGPSVLRYTRPPVRWWDRWEPFTRLHLVVLADDGTMRDLAPPKGLVLRQDPELALSADGTRVAHTCLREGERRLPLQAVQVRSTDDGRVLFERGVEGATGYGQLRLDATGHRLAVQRRIVHADRVTEKQLLIVEADGERRLDDGWDRWAAPEAFLDDGRLLVSFDDGGETRLALVAEDGTREELDLDGHHGGVKTAGRVIAGIGDGLKRPPRPFVLEGGARRWLAELSGVAEDELPFRVERLGVEASDGATVDCRLVLPPGDGPFPCLLWIHGGPVGYFGDQWHWRWCAGVMAAAGYAVALPNARGSTATASTS